VIIAKFGVVPPNLTDPLMRARSTDRSPFVHPGEPLGANPQPTAANPTRAANAPAIALQRLRERLEMAAILAGYNCPEQAAAALLGEGVQL
jgi:hypothetical protein